MPATEPILTVAGIRAAEQALLNAGRDVDSLMQVAGRGAAEWVWRLAAGRPVTLLCGPGNNGGDGYVIARTLHERALDVAVVAPLPPATGAAGSAGAAFAGRVDGADSGRRGAVLVDCLFGSGLTRPLSPDLACLLDQMARRHDLLVAVDVPSGVDSDRGVPLNAGLPAFDLTIALGAWKFAHWTMPAAAMMGARRLVDIGIDPGIDGGQASARLSSRPRLRAPAADAHKYRRGLLAVAGGAMPGAALLAAVAAQHGGAGYVKLLSPHSHPAAPPSLVVDERPLEEALADARITALLTGPGLGRDETAKARLACALARGLPLVLDADALALLERHVFGQETLLTPHEGELDGLCRAFGVEGTSKREKACALARASQAVVLAKGPDTCLCAPDGTLRLFPPGPSWLATAGTGDVLAGIAASRMASGESAFAAAEQAVWLHHEAALIAGQAFTAGQLAQAVKGAYARFL